MNRRVTWIAAALMLAVSGCGAGAGGGASPRSPTAAGRATPATSAITPASSPTASAGSASATPACLALSSWSEARLAAETVIVPVQESDVASVTTEVTAGAGGILLMGSSAPADLRSQIAALDAAAPGHLGLLAMTDEEGGGVQRMANLVGSLPWARDMAAEWTPAEITDRVAAVARVMAQNGVNMDLAPVVDVDGRDAAPGPANPDGWRSFGGSTAVVSADGIAYMDGLEEGGVTPVLKHFPGLGGASANTDNGAATTLPWSTLQTVGLPPFQAAIQNGAPAIMVSNAIVPGLTSVPASLSTAVITDELVGTLRFRGLILTDSLSARAIADAGFSVPNAAVAAIGAGADMVMYGPASPAETLAQFRAIVAAEVAAVGSGTLPRSRLVAAAGAALVARHLNVCS